MSLEKEITELLESSDDLFKIVNQFNEWAEKQHSQVMKIADKWLLQLYELDAHFFSGFLSNNVPYKHTGLIQEICQRAERDALQALFSAYYPNLGKDYINQEIPKWIDEKLSAKDIVQKLRWRMIGRKQLQLNEASLIAIYRYAPEVWEKDLLTDVFTYRHFIQFEDGHVFRNFRNEVKSALNAQRKETKTLYQALLLRFATTEEKEQELRDIIEQGTNWFDIKKQVEALQQWLNETLVQAIVDKFGNPSSEKTQNDLFKLLINHSDSFASQAIKTELAKVHDEAGMIKLVEQVRDKQIGWHRFYQLADAWILEVYTLAPKFCFSLIAGYPSRQLRISRGILDELLKMVLAKGQREFLKFIYSRAYSESEWNAALLSLSETDMTNASRSQLLDDLDCQPRYVYGNETRPYLYDEVAASLYKSNTDFLHSFILHNLNPSKTYTSLIEASRGHEDFFIIFRTTADAKMWEKEMLALLERDVPAEEIETELERLQLNRQSFNGRFRDAAAMDANILKGFISKYGTALLPFFERYVSWATEGRLKSLLALEIERGDLLKELTAIARREPSAFSRLSKVWAVPLYERGASFFESFFIRYIGRENEYTTRALLQRAETDGHENLFRALYRIVVRGTEWLDELNHAVRNLKTNEELEQFLVLRDVQNWDYVISDDVASALYAREADLYMPFILNHFAPRWGWGEQRQYPKLLKLAKSNEEHYLEILKRSNYQDYWVQSIENLLKENPHPTIAAERLQALHPRNTWDVRETGILYHVLKQFGAAVTPYIVKNINWVYSVKDFMETLESTASPSLFWQAVFETMHSHQQNSWSYKRWLAEFERLLTEKPSSAELRANLQLLSPTNLDNRWMRYQIPESLALSLYDAYPEETKGFIQAFYHPQGGLSLFKKASARKDEEMLDYLCFRIMEHVNGLIYQAFPPERAYYRHPNQEAKEKLETLSTTVIERFENLYQESPQSYVKHAAQVLAWWRPFAIWNPSAMRDHHPIYHYLVTKHLEAWLDSGDAIREVLESPNIFVQIIALKILQKANGEAFAERILENKRIFRQLLLGRARRNTKKLALACLEKAIATKPAYAPFLLPIIGESADFYGRFGISEEAMLSYSRIHHALEQGLAIPITQLSRLQTSEDV